MSTQQSQHGQGQQGYASQPGQQGYASQPGQQGQKGYTNQQGQQGYHNQPGYAGQQSYTSQHSHGNGHHNAPGHHSNASGHKSMDRSVQEQMMRERLRNQGGSGPPKLRPPMIIFMVMALGALFVGLIMTVIANWPGFSPYGGNPLAIAGPIVLAIGGVAFIGGLANVCWKVKKDNAQAMKQNSMRSSHGSLGSRRHNTSKTGSQGSVPSLDARPAKSILKKAGSTSTYGKGSDGGESDSGVAVNHTPASVNKSYEPDRSTDGSDSSMQYQRSPRVEMDPMPGRGDPRSTRPVDQSSSIESDSRTPYGQAQRGRPVYSNVGYSGEGEDYHGDVTTEAPNGVARKQTRRPMQTYPTDGFDVYDADGSKHPTAGSGATGQAPPRGVPNAAYDDEGPRQTSSVVLEVPRTSSYPPGTTPQTQYQQQQPGTTHYQQQMTTQRQITTTRMQPGTYAAQTPPKTPTTPSESTEV